MVGPYPNPLIGIGSGNVVVHSGSLADRCFDEVVVGNHHNRSADSDVICRDADATTKEQELIPGRGIDSQALATEPGAARIKNPCTGAFG